MPFFCISAFVLTRGAWVLRNGLSCGPRCRSGLRLVQAERNRSSFGLPEGWTHAFQASNLPAMNQQNFSRREFLARTVTTGVAAAFVPGVLAAEASEKRFKIIVFTKPFRTLNAVQTADLVAEVGWDGVELPVRGKEGQLTADNVDDQLPKFAEALRARGREVTIVTTDITSPGCTARFSNGPNFTSFEPCDVPAARR